jgi:hypothetical protein
MNNPIFVLTSEVIDGWRAEEAEAKRLIAEGQRRLAEVGKKLDAAAVLTAIPAQTSPGESHDDDAPSDDTHDAETSEELPRSNLTEAIERLANASARPLSRPDLRRMLAQEGFPESRLSNYFYTVIARLKKHGRITVKRDGSLGRARPKEPRTQEIRASSASLIQGERSTPTSHSGDSQPGLTALRPVEPAPGGGT